MDWKYYLCRRITGSWSHDVSSAEEVTRPTDESAERTSEPRIVDLRFELPTYRADLLITAEEKVSANIKALRNRAVIAIAVSVVAGVVGFLVNFTIGFRESWSFFVSAGAVAIGPSGHPLDSCLCCSGIARNVRTSGRQKHSEEPTCRSVKNAGRFA